MLYIAQSVISSHCSTLIAFKYPRVKKRSELDVSRPNPQLPERRLKMTAREAVCC